MSNHCIHGNELNGARLMKLTTIPRFQPLNETRASIGLSFDYGRRPMSNHSICGDALNSTRLVKFTAVPGFQPLK